MFLTLLRIKRNHYDINKLIKLILKETFEVRVKLDSFLFSLHFANVSYTGDMNI